MSIITKDIPLNSFTVSIQSVRKIYRGLQKVVFEEADLQLAKWTLLPEQTQEQMEERKKEVRPKAFQVTVSIFREDGSHTYGSSEDIFELSGGESFVSRIFMTNKTAFRGIANFDPPNSFQLTLDFSQPPLLDAQNIASSPTRNASSLSIGGEREGWFAGVEKIVSANIDKSHKLRSRFHGPFVYDYGLICVGLPFAFYICWLFSDLIEGIFSNKAPILQGAVYIYVVIASVWAYRILFGYSKWAFPLVELKEQQKRPGMHRRFWWGLIVLLVGKLFWDFFDPYLSVSRWFGGSVP